MRPHQIIFPFNVFRRVQVVVKENMYPGMFRLGRSGNRENGLIPENVVEERTSIFLTGKRLACQAIVPGTSPDQWERLRAFHGKRVHPRSCPHLNDELGCGGELFLILNKRVRFPEFPLDPGVGPRKSLPQGYGWFPSQDFAQPPIIAIASANTLGP